MSDISLQNAPGEGQLLELQSMRLQTLLLRVQALELMDFRDDWQPRSRVPTDLHYSGLYSF